MPSEPKDLASRCRAGRTAICRELQESWLHRRRWDGSLPRSALVVTPGIGVTTSALRSEIAAIAVPATPDGGNMTGKDFDLTASWGHFGQGQAVMPGQDRVVERAYTAEERAALSRVAPLGETTFDIYLNDRAYWRNVPAAVWTYTLGGYQVLQQWLSYRESHCWTGPSNPKKSSTSPTPLAASQPSSWPRTDE